MKTLRNPEDRKAMIERIGRVKDDLKPIWGKMTAEQMMSHLVQTGEMPFEQTPLDHSNFWTNKLAKPLMLYLLPMPKEIKVSAEMDQQKEGRKPQGIETDRAALIDLTNRLGTLPPEHACMKHPFFGSMTAKEWAAIGYKHIDHHLRQFGV